MLLHLLLRLHHHPAPPLLLLRRAGGQCRACRGCAELLGVVGGEDRPPASGGLHQGWMPSVSRHTLNTLAAAGSFSDDLQYSKACYVVPFMSLSLLDQCF